MVPTHPAGGQFRRRRSGRSSSTTSRRASASPTTCRATARRWCARTTRRTTARSAPARVAGHAQPGHRRSTAALQVGGRQPRQVRRAAERDLRQQGRPAAQRRQPGELPERDRQLGSGRTRSLTTKNTVNPNLKNDKTDEFILGVDREIGAGFAVGASYIWRNYSNFNWSPVNGVSTDGSTLHGGRRYTGAGEHVLRPVRLPDAHLLPAERTARQHHHAAEPGRLQPRVQRRGTDGARKRMSHHWLMNTSFSYNSTIVNYGPGSYQDPTNIAQRNGYQYDYLTAGSGVGNVYINAAVALQAERPGQPAARASTCRRSTTRGRATLKSSHRHQPVAGQRRGHRDGAARQRRREPSAGVPERRPSLRSPGEDRHGALRAEHRRVQPDQQQHGAGAARCAEQLERELHPGDRRAAGRALRHPRKLVSNVVCKTPEGGGFGPALFLRYPQTGGERTSVPPRFWRIHPAVTKAPIHPAPDLTPSRDGGAQPGSRSRGRRADDRPRRVPEARRRTVSRSPRRARSRSARGG